MRSRLSVSSTIIDGEMVGLNRAGEQLCVMHVTPTMCVTSIDGEVGVVENVCTWLVSHQHMRRVVALRCWLESGYVCQGQA